MSTKSYAHSLNKLEYLCDMEPHEISNKIKLKKMEISMNRDSQKIPQLELELEVLDHRKYISIIQKKLKKLKGLQ